MIAKRAYVAILFLLVACLPAAGQQPETVLSGIVRSQAGNPIANARITLQPDNTAARAAVTDANGRFTVRGLPPGNYDVTAEAAGFYPAVERGVPVSYDLPSEVELRAPVLPSGDEVRSGEPNVASVQIFYATDRKPSGKSDARSYFSGDRNLSGGPMQSGTAEVTVPYSHKKATLERPSYVQGLFFEPDPRKHFVLADVLPMRDDVFQRTISRQLQGSGSRDILVFVHGYNNTFEDAAVRLAQLTLDLDFRGIPILFNWPSTGVTVGYKYDEGNVEWATFHFQSFLEKLASTYPGRPIYVIAHSMGSRALSYALRNLSMGAARPHFSQTVQAAPDIDAAVFRELAGTFRNLGAHITLYVSADDFALRKSAQLAGYPRAGQGGPTG